MLAHSTVFEWGRGLSIPDATRVFSKVSTDTKRPEAHHLPIRWDARWDELLTWRQPATGPIACNAST